jgi:hypothetical protein
MRDWLEGRAPWWVLGIIDWPKYRLFSRCFVCGRLVVLHTPWALFVCERTPLPLEITDKGYALLEQLEQEAALADLPDTDWQLVPASQMHVV